MPIFWDKNINERQIKKILSDEANARFVEFASLLLSRSNEPKKVFADYLTKADFCKNWFKIKRRMRQNKWNDSRIIFWDEIYRAVRKKLNIKNLMAKAQRPLVVDAQIKNICDQIRDVRKKSGLTQIELAEKSGLSQQAISFVEKGYVNISLRTLKKIADALNLKIILEEHA